MFGLIGKKKLLRHKIEKKIHKKVFFDRSNHQRVSLIRITIDANILRYDENPTAKKYILSRHEHGDTDKTSFHASPYWSGYFASFQVIKSLYNFRNSLFLVNFYLMMILSIFNIN
jgi:hypothetical protein